MRRRVGIIYYVNGIVIVYKVRVAVNVIYVMRWNSIATPPRRRDRRAVTIVIQPESNLDRNDDTDDREKVIGSAFDVCGRVWGVIGHVAYPRYALHLVIGANHNNHFVPFSSAYLPTYKTNNFFAGLCAFSIYFTDNSTVPRGRNEDDGTAVNAFSFGSDNNNARGMIASRPRRRVHSVKNSQFYYDK